MDFYTPSFFTLDNVSYLVYLVYEVTKYKRI